MSSDNVHNHGGARSTLPLPDYLVDNKEMAEESDEKHISDAASEHHSRFDTLDSVARLELTTLASHAHSQRSGRRSSVASDPEALHRKGTLDGLDPNDEVFDPSSPKFDLYKWLRMTMRLVDEEGIKMQRSGVVFKDVNVSGSGSALNIQGTVGDILTAPFRAREILNSGGKSPRKILRNFHGLVKSGELLIVLGRPGSGCSTLLKTLTGQTYGLDLSEDSTIHYHGLPQKQMLKEFRGEVIYNQEVDKHFPHLTVGQTLEHAAALRLPQHRPTNTTRKEAIEHITKVIMAVYGLTHTYNTKVGNDFVRGVSGGERKRVSIAEMALAGCLVGAWDNSTRGLDSATALTFAKSLRLTADIVGSSHIVAVYQASQAIYDLFDKAVVLYEGREIFFGKADRAKKYFERMGWYCPPRQTTGDFLTSITNPGERQAIEGFEDRVPRTPDEFERYWHQSPEFAELQREIQDYDREHPIGDATELEAFQLYKRDAQSKHTRPQSSYVVNVWMQIRLNAKRSAQLKWNDKPATFTPIISNIIMALIIGSVYYGSADASINFVSRAAVIFFAVLLNALAAITEVTALYEQRPVVEKHKSYAFYHPATEAIAGIFLDMPVKFLQAVAFNVTLYFLAGLRSEPSQFFIFFVFSYIVLFVMSAAFRTTAAVTQTVAQAMALSGVLVLVIVIYAGFVISVPYMHDWFAWLRWINPIYYAFEALMANEFHGRNFTCSGFVPAYNNLQGDSFICSSIGAVAGERTVNGDRYIETAFGYTYSHVWRNFGVLLAFLVGLMGIYFTAVELNSETTSTAEVLVFRRGHVPKYVQDMAKGENGDKEAGQLENAPAVGDSPDANANATFITPQTDIFTWRDVTYDVDVKGGTRRLLDNVSGFVKPGTLTALMGTSGAGKTTLLDVLAHRTTMGVVTGSMFVNGAPLDDSFQRKTGYVQQQDLHLETATVRESLRFSAMLRQPESVSRAEKYAYVEDVIKMLSMEDFAEAVVGVPGEGLNVEQRKLLTIGVELAAKPKLLLFLDEPTSGLDSQSSWAICALLRKLADHGQAVLCTIHQPSAILFQQFDRLLFLRKGGQTVYFGNIGEQSRTLLDYFESNGARPCDNEENPAEYMLEIVGGNTTDWVSTWNNSRQASEVQEEINRLHAEKGGQIDSNDNSSAHFEFAMPFSTQLSEVTYRVFQQYWRMPQYIMAKVILNTASGLFIGFSFYNSDSTIAGMRYILYSLFMVTTIFSTLVQQIMPLFITQRSLYEVRERPSKAYSWKAFIIANIIVEIPYQIICGLVLFATFYYPIVSIQSSERQVIVLLFCVVFMIYASTFSQMCIAALPDAQTAGSIATLLFAMSLIFNGVMQAPDALPGFWIFMYRVSPFTYIVAGMGGAMLHGRQVICSAAELSRFNPPSGQTCAQYMQDFLATDYGHLINPNATENCGYCSTTVADTFLGGFKIKWSERWRNFGLVWVYIFFNIAAVVVLYYFGRVYPGTRSGKKASKRQQTAKGTEQRSTNNDNGERSEPQGALSNGTALVQNYVHRVASANLARSRTNPDNARVF